MVVVDPNTGRILSIVNQKLALSGAYAPCSTFKPVVALAGLNEGLITPQTRIRVWRRGRMDLTEALAKSNNTYFEKLGDMLGFERLALYARIFGLGQRAGLYIPDESAGGFPTAPPEDGGVRKLSSYGQDIAITPLQMAALISTIANGGDLYYLQCPRTPEEIAQFTPKLKRRLEILVEQIPKIKDGLAEAVVNGTAQVAYDLNEQIFGKTGTCSEDGVRLGWFASYADEQQPKYAVVVLLLGGASLYGRDAAEVAARVYRGLRSMEERATQASGPSRETIDTTP